MSLYLLICILLVDTFLLLLVISIHTVKKGIQEELDKISSSLKLLRDRVDRIEKEHKERVELLTASKIKMMEEYLKDKFNDTVDNDGEE